MRSSEQLPQQTLLEGRCRLEHSLVVKAEIEEFLDVEVGVEGELEESVRVLPMGSVEEGVGCSIEGAQFSQDGRRLWEIQLLRLSHLPHFLLLDALLFEQVLSEHVFSFPVILVQLVGVSDELVSHL